MPWPSPHAGEAGHLAAGGLERLEAVRGRRRPRRRGRSRNPRPRRSGRRVTPATGGSSRSPRGWPRSTVPPAGRRPRRSRAARRCRHRVGAPRGRRAAREPAVPDADDLPPPEEGPPRGHELGDPRHGVEALGPGRAADQRHEPLADHLGVLEALGHREVGHPGAQGGEKVACVTGEELARAVDDTGIGLDGLRSRARRTAPSHLGEDARGPGPTPVRAARVHWRRGSASCTAATAVNSADARGCRAAPA